MALPEKIKCTVTNWNYIYDLCRDLSSSVVESGYDPDVIVALARGGWFAGRMVCDFLGISDLISLKVEHYVGTARLADECRVRYPIAEEMVKDKRVLIVDDIADTGKSLQHASDYVKEFKPADCRTGYCSCSSLQKLGLTTLLSFSKIGCGWCIRGILSKI